VSELIKIPVRVYCTKCDVDMKNSGIALDCPSDGVFYICPKCQIRIVIYKGFALTIKEIKKIGGCIKFTLEDAWLEENQIEELKEILKKLEVELNQLKS